MYDFLHTVDWIVDDPIMVARAFAARFGLPDVRGSMCSLADASGGTRTNSRPSPRTGATESVGLVDVYRRHHPDAVANPGLTWPAARPFVTGYNPHLNGAPSDRIDLMYVSSDIGPI